MAVLAPVLERKINTEEVVAEKTRNAYVPTSVFTADVRRNTFMSAEEHHNSRIKSNYEKLINPDSTVSDIIHNEVQQKKVEEPAVEQAPYLVENARADSDLFRVDSMINSRQAEPETGTDLEEEENEDLRPSDETFKYKTKSESKIVVDDKISNKEKKVSKFSKRDKIIMVVAIVVIVALFALVIINSAVLSNLNHEVSYLQDDLAVAQENYEAVLESKENYFANIEETVADFARQNGMSKIAGDK